MEKKEIKNKGPEERHGKLRQKGETGDRGPGGHSEGTVVTLKKDKGAVPHTKGQDGIGSAGGPGH